MSGNHAIIFRLYNMHEKKAKTSGRIRKTFFSLLGNDRSRSFLQFVLQRKQRSSPLSFPIDTVAVKEILLILPEDHLAVLHQLRNIIALMTQFKHAGISLLCERHVSAYIKMIPGLSIIEYDADEHYSAAFSAIAQQFRGKTDICFLLDEEPALPILYLAGSTGAVTRVGYAGAGTYPFINLQVRPAAQWRYLSDRYLSMATLFGAKRSELKWRVAQKTIEEVDHLIKELKIAPESPMTGFDALFFIRSFGITWTEAFLYRVRSIPVGTLYFIVEHEPQEQELVWLCKQNIPTFAELSASRMAALVSKSRLVISGNTPMYALAGLLHRPAVGFFKKEEMDQYCPQTNQQRGFAYNAPPDDSLIDQVLQSIKTLYVPPKQH